MRSFEYLSTVFFTAFADSFVLIVMLLVCSLLMLVPRLVGSLVVPVNLSAGLPLRQSKYHEPKASDFSWNGFNSFSLSTVLSIYSHALSHMFLKKPIILSITPLIISQILFHTSTVPCLMPSHVSETNLPTFSSHFGTFTTR